MTKEERLEAFRLRMEGKTYEEIGAKLHYSARNVQKDLQSVVEKTAVNPNIIYPKLEEIIRTQCGGSINAFARALQVSRTDLRQFLIHGAAPSERLLERIEAVTRLTREEALQDDLHL